ncbi:TPA: hypothetical protein QDZ84_003446 [Shewanella algae]|uniref:hypothetical protein n=1 Tax=Shewanella algae TaxID=38313 RepID=UPI001C57B1C8|nr:hypothetical protein [Shewanella algae]HDS1208407.1 hypothetical protein [Shewanella algae]
MPDVVLTKKEQQAIAELEKLAKKWPKTLKLFSWSSSLCVFKEDTNGTDCLVGSISGIPNDGGDPDDVNQYPEIEYK